MDPLTTVPASPVTPPQFTPQPTKRPLIVAIISLVVVAVIALAAFAWFAWPIPGILERHQVDPLAAAFNQNDLDGTIALADQLLAQNPNDTSAMVAKALALAQKGSLTFKEVEYGAQAATLVQAAIDLDQANADAWRVLAYSYEIRQDYLKAHQYYAEALKRNPNSVAALFGDAHSYDLQGDLVKAEAGYRATLAVDPTFEQAHAGLGRVLAAKGDIEGAKKEFETSLATAANVRVKAEASYSYGMLVLKDDRNSSIEYMRQAVSFDPAYPLAWYGLGRALIQKAVSPSELSSDEREAIANEGIDALYKSLELNPNQAVVYVELSRVVTVLANDPTEGLRLLDEAQKVVPNDITLSATAKASVLRLIEQLRAAFKEEQKKK